MLTRSFLFLQFLFWKMELKGLFKRFTQVGNNNYWSSSVKFAELVPITAVDPDKRRRYERRFSKIRW